MPRPTERPIDRIFARAIDKGFTKPDGTVNLRALARAAAIGHDQLVRARDSDTGRLGVDAYSALARALESSVSILLGEEAPQSAGAVALLSAPHARIHPSELNYRKRFDPEKQAELDSSVLQRGILLPLLVRYANADGNRAITGAAPGDFEIIAGERRWRAARAHIESGAWPQDWPVPIKLIDPCSDRELLELALTENKDRADTTPWEEAQAFATLRGMGATAAEIAKSSGVVKRTVEKRLKLVTDLAPAAQLALEGGHISVEAANILASFAKPVDQPEMLNRLTKGEFRTTADLKAAILRQVIPESRATFDLALYTGEWIQDEDAGTRYFVDTKAFAALQIQAAQDKARHFKASGKYAWVEIYDNGKGRHFHTYKYLSRPRHPQAGVAIVIGTDLGVTLYTDMVDESILDKEAKAARKTSGGEVPAIAVDPITKAHGGRAANRKTAALQTAIVGQPRIAMQLVILSLIDGTRDAVKIRAEHTATDDRIIAAKPRAVIEAFLAGIKDASATGFEIDASGPGQKGWGNLDEAAIWQGLESLEDHGVEELFSAIVALRTGCWNNGQPDIGDRPVVVEIARSLGLAGNEIRVGLAAQPEDLDGLRKPALLAVAELSGQAHAIPRPHALSEMSAKELKAGLAEVITGAYVLPSFRFATRDAVLTAFAAAAPPVQTTLDQAIAASAAIKPLPLPPDFETIRQTLSPFSIFAAKAEPGSALNEMVGVEDYDRLATTLSQTFAIAITRDDLTRVGDLVDLRALIDLRTLEKSQAA